MILIAIQTSVPSIKTKKTFPGCARSFMGYPIEGAGDETALKYISCIAYNIRTAIEPWNVLQRKKSDFIQSKIKDAIDKNLWLLPDVTRKVEEKLAYLLTNKDNEIPIEHDIQQWKQFLPPLAPIKIKNLENITPQFKSKLMNSIKNGSTSQREELLIVDSKIIFFSLSIQEKIQEIISKKKLLLSTANNILFMENACCNENDEYSTIEYFIKENGEILLYNNIVGELENILEDIKYVTEPAFMLSRENTKMKYPSLASDIFDEETIYRSFIVYCHFTSLIPIGEDLIALCNNKPEMTLKGLTIEEQINKLKRDNRIYTNDSLLRLLQVVNRHNIVSVELDKPQITSIQRLRNLIENLDDKPSENININKKLLSLIEPTLDTFDIAITQDTDEMKNLKNYLVKANDFMKDKILNFIKKNSNLKKNTLKQVSTMLNNLFNIYYFFI
jgi:archaellum biogenesis ATPase FlaH